MPITEWTFQGDALSWIKWIIKNLPFNDASQEETIEKSGGKRPDIRLYDKNNRVACVISLKRPEYNGYALDIIDDACDKANRLGCRFFAIWNVNKFVLWDTFREGTPLIDRRRYHKDVLNIRHIEEYRRHKEKIKEFLRTFLEEFVEIYYVKKALPTLPLDRIFIDRLRSAVDTFYIPISDYMKEEYSRYSQFKNNLLKWCYEQKWTFQGEEEDFDRIARLNVLLHIAKLISYYFLKTKINLSPIRIPRDINHNNFERILYGFFDNSGYKEIFERKFIEGISIPEDAVNKFIDLIEEFELYNFSKLSYEILGSIFEKLIPDSERHKLGQYFTRSDVVDLIIGFCIKNERDKVLDPACGAGTFLTRAYAWKEEKTDREYKDIINELKGIDIADFPCYLTKINLATRDIFDRRLLDVKNQDFLDKSLDLDEFDVIVTNPPYTRQEEMEDLLFSSNYRNELQNLIRNELKFYVGKRSSIYVYFFLRSTKFLKEEGRMGLITSNSWLNVDYGKYLQEFFLKKFKITAIVESKVERWFEDADVNTTITVLEKCSREKERNENLVKFIQLKKPLTEFISEVEEERWNSADRFVKFVEEKEEYYEDERIKIFPKRQKELWNEGFNLEEGKYKGSKWGKYLRAPKIFFKILEKGKNKFVPLKEVADVRFGIKTGANEFFYLTEEEIEKWGIEKEFWMHKDENGNWIPNYVIKSPREYKKIVVDPGSLKYRILMIPKDKKELKGTNILRYIEWGEEQEFHKRPTCISRKRWYDLGKRDFATNLWTEFFFDSHKIFRGKNVYEGDKFYGITYKTPQHEQITCCFLTSTLVILYRELSGFQSLGQGALKMPVYEVEKLPVLDPTKINSENSDKLTNALNKMSKHEMGSIFDEIGSSLSEKISLDKVKQSRKELDKIVMREILGLSKKEQLEVYKAVIDLVRTRIERAKSVSRGDELKGIDIKTLINALIEEIGVIKKFPEDFILSDEYEEISAPCGEAEVKSDINGFYVSVSGEEIRCNSLEEAKYIRYCIINKKTVRIPKDKEKMKKAVEEYSLFLDNIREKINGLLEYRISDNKTRKKVERELWNRVLG